MGPGGGRQRLRELIARFRPQVRADLQQQYGVDLAVWWRERRFVALLDLIDQLPQTSRLNEALLNDPEQARLIVAAREASTEEPEPWAPRYAEFDLHAQMLRDVIESLAGLRAAVLATARIPPGPHTRYPTPITEVEREKARVDRLWAQSVLSRYGFDASDY